MCSKWWRPVGFWGLTLNAVLGFPVLLAALWIGPEGRDWSIMTALYPTVLATWAVAAGIRQWGKATGSEAETPRPFASAPPEDFIRATRGET